MKPASPHNKIFVHVFYAVPLAQTGLKERRFFVSILPTQPAPVFGAENYVIGVIHMIFQATLSNKAHPEYGVTTIPLASRSSLRLAGLWK